MSHYFQNRPLARSLLSNSSITNEETLILRHLIDYSIVSSFMEGAPSKNKDQVSMKFSYDQDKFNSLEFLRRPESNTLVQPERRFSINNL